MHTLPSPLSASPGFSHFAAFGDTPHMARARQVDTHTQARTDLTVVTAEGDRVTLSAHTTQQAGYSGYDASGRIRHQSPGVYAEAFEVTVAETFSIAVAGDLNDQEVADIQHLLGDIEEIATGFFAGVPDQELIETLGLSERGTLASFVATLELTHQVHAEQLVYTAPGQPNLESPVAGAAPQTGHLLEAIAQRMQDVRAATGRFANQSPALLNQFLEWLTGSPDNQAAEHDLASANDATRV